MSREAFAELRTALDIRYRETTTAAFTLAAESVVATGLAALDRVLGGGFPRGAIATLEGPPSSGRTTIGARLLAQATRNGVGALVHVDPLYPPSLEAAGVDLRRLMIVPAAEGVAAARAADILVRSGAFGVVLVPAIGPARGINAATWTRLAGLAHRTNTCLVALGNEASSELRFFASLRVETRIVRVRWNGAGGIYAELAGYDIEATVRKHKRAVPGGKAIITCRSFEDRPSPALVRVRELDERFEWGLDGKTLCGGTQ
jgi:hypothetical protein